MHKKSETRINNLKQPQEITGANGVLIVGTGANRRTNEIENVSALPREGFSCDRCVEVFTNDLFIHVLYYSTVKLY